MSMLTPGQPDLSGEATVDLPCLPLLLEYARRHPADLDEVRIRIGPPGTRPDLAEGRSGSLEGLEDDAAVEFLLETCDGTRVAQDLVALSPVSEEATLRMIYGLMLVGALVQSTRKEDARTQSDVVTRDEVRARMQKVENANCYAVLELGAACTTEQVRNAYYFLARRYHPDRFRSGPLADLIDSIEDFFTRVTEAYNTLVDPDRREEYDRQLAQARGPVKAPTDHDAKELARQNYLHARALIERGRYTDAVKSLQNAIKLDVREPKYHIEIGKLMSRNPRMRGEAEEHLKEAARLDPAQVDSYLALGELYEKMNRREDARAQFREVLRWEPDHVAASTHLASLE
jgi:curved DNA-binding protein CbpA